MSTGVRGCRGTRTESDEDLDLCSVLCNLDTVLTTVQAAATYLVSFCNYCLWWRHTVKQYASFSAQHEECVAMLQEMGKPSMTNQLTMRDIKRFFFICRDVLEKQSVPKSLCNSPAKVSEASEFAEITMDLMEPLQSCLATNCTPQPSTQFLCGKKLRYSAAPKLLLLLLLLLLSIRTLRRSSLPFGYVLVKK